ncbi:MAG: tRNA (N(6)-L-threonylcarbamoyladenosine(37)-C(2))-methylthiotransferase MtaB, partial [Clostridia bacterium]|nr:tRNA (N(6)-L-threonylcarbamoyladenosine(37)-C(2))-methylthiotransferase MtaB [Clostridia bacterium]
AIERVRRYIPDATFSADVIVGFPGETDEEFLETVEFCKKAEFLHLHIFPYSKREGTEAATMDGQVPENIKKQRAAALSAVSREIQERLLDKYVNDHGENCPVYVLCETVKDSTANGHTEHFIECDFKTDQNLVGVIVPVALTGRRGSVLLGKVLV